MRRTKLEPLNSVSKPSIEDNRKTLEAFRVDRPRLKKPLLATHDDTATPDGLDVESVITYQPFKLDMELKDTVVKVR